ncbi:MAG: endo-1,4-beta-xylanase [Terracidiphilus sp.]
MKHKRQYANAADPNVTGPNSLQAHAAARGLVYGTAAKPGKLDLEGVAKGNSADGYTQLVMAQAGMLVDEYTTYGRWLRPTPEKFDFTSVDRLMRFAQLTGKRVRGHVLVWHEAMPRWFGSVANRENARKLLVDHIHTVAGHLKGRIDTWDVVNEAVEPHDGRPDGLRKSPWLELIGPEYIEMAFRAAAEADPQAKLAYNDFAIETDSKRDAKKREMVLALLQRLKGSGVPIQVVGVQSHLWPARGEAGRGLQEFIREAAKMGLEVHISELDVSCAALKGGPAQLDSTVGRVYGNYLNLVLAEPNVTQVITWGITDADTWLKTTWLYNPADKRGIFVKFVEGLGQRPLPFGDDYAAKPAFWALRGALDGRSREQGTTNAGNSQ